MTDLRTPTRTTAAGLLLAAVVSFSTLAACRPRPAPPAAATATPQAAADDTTDGRFTLAVRVDPDDPTRITVVVTSSDAAFAGLDAEAAEGLIEVRAEAAVLGSLEQVSDRELHFSPAFPLLAGTELVVRFDPAAVPTIDGTALQRRHTVP